jgi:hypothetical protein
MKEEGINHKGTEGTEDERKREEGSKKRDEG